MGRMKTVHELDDRGNQHTYREVVLEDAVGNEHVYRFEESDDGLVYVGDGEPSERALEVLNEDWR